MVIVCVYIFFPVAISPQELEMQNQDTITRWLTNPSLAHQLPLDAIDGTYRPFQGRFYHIEGPPLIDLTSLTAMADGVPTQRQQEIRQPDSSYQDTLLPPYGTTAEYQALEGVTTTHLDDMRRCLDIIESWKAIIPASKLAGSVHRILDTEAATMKSRIEEISIMSECARSCLSPRSRYQATLQVIGVGRLAHGDSVQSFAATPKMSCRSSISTRRIPPRTTPRATLTKRKCSRNLPSRRPSALIGKTGEGVARATTTN